MERLHSPNFYLKSCVGLSYYLLWFPFCSLAQTFYNNEDRDWSDSLSDLVYAKTHSYKTDSTLARICFVNLYISRLARSKVHKSERNHPYFKGPFCRRFCPLEILSSIRWTWTVDRAPSFESSPCNPFFFPTESPADTLASKCDLLDSKL